jgi:hypothetical protein
MDFEIVRQLKSTKHQRCTTAIEEEASQLETSYCFRLLEQDAQ